MWVISRANAFDTSGQRLCISGSTSRPGFTVINNLRYTGAWQAYPFTGAGCGLLPVLPPHRLTEAGAQAAAVG